MPSSFNVIGVLIEFLIDHQLLLKVPRLILNKSLIISPRVFVVFTILFIFLQVPRSEQYYLQT